MVWFDQKSKKMNFYVKKFEHENKIGSREGSLKYFCPSSSDVILGKLFLTRVEFTVNFSGSGLVKYGFRPLDDGGVDPGKIYRISKFVILVLSGFLFTFILLTCWVLKRPGIDKVDLDQRDGTMMFDEEGFKSTWDSSADFGDDNADVVINREESGRKHG